MLQLPNLRDRLRTLSKCVCDSARLMVGQGDYAAYVEHVRRTHPDRVPMTEVEFFRNRENARFGVGNTSGVRCC
ncbi:YbdD/YjiX family protein [Methylobacterium sp. P31]